MNSRNTPRFIVIAISVLLFMRMPLAAQSLKFAKVVSQRVARTTELPGEIYPFLTVQLHAKVPSYVEKVLVDRGSFVKTGELLIQLSAPEMMAHISQAEAQVTSAESDESQAEAQLAAAHSTYLRIEEASKTPGAVAENDIVQARQQSEAAQALVRSRQRTVESFKSNLKSQQDLASYLRVTAPFDGVISTRYVHPGTLVGPGSDVPLLQLDQISHLRLAVAVPESDVAGLMKGMKVGFKVPAYPGRTFSGVIARPAHALDMKTRTMPVELDLANPERLLAPGMYPSVLWPVERSGASLLVPPTSVVTTTERVFVIRNNHGHAEWVDVRRGPTAGNLVEVSGDLRPGDEIVERGTDEIRDGSELKGSKQ
ncbi:MAG TPA: efflux RND transporter periplasmic adaptor subunit [Bryobacteraceae bacterium]|nr:efflux RND transporter periplasmic adaptor subunit [Bryobacteraceae bacterium]